MRKPSTLAELSTAELENLNRAEQNEYEKEQLELLKMQMSVCSHLKDLLSFLIDVGINPSVVQHSPFATIYPHTPVWLEHLSLILELYISVSESFNEHNQDCISLEGSAENDHLFRENPDSV